MGKILTEKPRRTVARTCYVGEHCPELAVKDASNMQETAVGP